MGITPARPLTARQRAFVLAFRGRAAGNATKAAILAGFSRNGATSRGAQLIANVNVRRALEQREAAAERTSIANAQERDEILSMIARDKGRSSLNRMIAIKELNKVNGRHTVRHQLEGKITLEQALTASHLEGGGDE